jgi:23S rRNA pseudouridine1911/1915/1917 synthase
LLRCILETGRQHQIRVHLAANGVPVVGDKLYGPDEELFGRGADGELTEDDAVVLEMRRHALHAAVLELGHPAKPNERLRLEAPLPYDMASFWNELSADGAKD